MVRQPLAVSRGSVFFFILRQSSTPWPRFAMTSLLA
jgi:hypothetical protein